VGSGHGEEEKEVVQVQQVDRSAACLYRSILQHIASDDVENSEQFIDWIADDGKLRRE
jgi:hypothetical protein